MHGVLASDRELLQLCACSSSSEALQQASSHVSWVEWRVDLLGLQPYEQLDPERILWSWRIAPSCTASERPADPERVSQLQRTAALTRALHHYGRVDLQVGLDESLLRSLRPALASKVILSYHGPFEGLEALEQLLKGLRAHRHVYAWKIALDFSNADALAVARCFDLLVQLSPRWRRKVIFVPMGERFSAWRLLACQHLCPFLYCSAATQFATAAGQPSYSSLRYLSVAAGWHPEGLLFGLVGNPVSQSISHLSHNRLFQKLQLPASYLKFALEERELASWLSSCFRWGVRGLSVTVPYKQQALSLAASASACAIEAGSANTLIWRGDGWHADNTDYKAFITFFKSAGVGPHSCILVIGSGGSARAALAAAVDLGAHVELVARNRQAAGELAQQFGALYLGEGGVSRQQMARFDLLVQASSIGMTQQPSYPFELEDLQPFTCVIELVNAASGDPLPGDDASCFYPTALLSHAQRQANPHIDPRSFFLRQAAYQLESFLQLPRASALLQPLSDSWSSEAIYAMLQTLEL